MRFDGKWLARLRCSRLKCAQGGARLKMRIANPMAETTAPSNPMIVGKNRRSQNVSNFASQV